MTSYDYKVDFSDVRREDHMTFFVFPRRDTPLITRWLKNSGIGGWEIRRPVEAEPYLPKDFVFPAVQGPGDAYPITERKRLAVFMSFYNTDDLKAKFEYMTNSVDAANLQLTMGDENEAVRKARLLEEDTNWMDPPPTSDLRQDKNQFDPGGKRKNP